MISHSYNILQTTEAASMTGTISHIFSHYHNSKNH